MPLCHKCHEGYGPSLETCPKCGTPKPAPFFPHEQKSFAGDDALFPRCGSFEIFCLWCAFVASILLVGLSLVGAVQAIVTGKLFDAAFTLFLVSPALTGVSVALRLAIRYARGED